MDTVESKIPDLFKSLIRNGLQVFTIVLVITITIPVFLIFLIPIFVLYFFIQVKWFVLNEFVN